MTVRIVPNLVFLATSTMPPVTRICLMKQTIGVKAGMYTFLKEKVGILAGHLRMGDNVRMYSDRRW